MPGIRCGSCSRFMTPTDGAKCGKCNISFHRLCVALPQTGNIGANWRCVDCKAKGNKGSAPTMAISPEAASPVVTDALNEFESELRTVREELRTVRNEIRAFCEEMTEIRALKCRVDGIEKRLDALEQTSNQNGTSPIVEEMVAKLNQKLNDRDQELLANDAEINNIPESINESLTHTVKLVAAKLGVTLEDGDIVSVDRAGNRRINATDSSGPSESRPRPIVVRLLRRELRDALVKSARVRRGANSADLGISGPPQRFYINERLTKQNRLLFRQARDAGQQMGWKYVWTSRGRILARKSAGDVVHRISSETDIHRFFKITEKNAQSPRQN